MISAFAKTLFATACLATATCAASAQSAADFYKGKTVQIVVGFGVGGGYDLYARALSRYLGKHLPGNPNVVVQNMEGAGSVRAANYVYAGSPQDGTVIAAVNQNMPMYQMLGGAGAKFEAAGMQWLGSMTNSNGLIYTWHTSGIKTLDDAKQRDVPMGAVGAASDSVIFPNLVNEMVGTKFKPIAGYAGSAQINLAMERGEVMGRGGNSWSSVQTANMSWVKENKIYFLVQVGFEKEPDLPQVPLLLDLVSGRRPQGRDQGRQPADRARLRTLGCARRAERPRRGAARCLRRGHEGSRVPEGDREDRHGDPCSGGRDARCTRAASGHGAEVRARSDGADPQVEVSAATASSMQQWLYPPLIPAKAGIQDLLSL